MRKHLLAQMLGIGSVAAAAGIAIALAIDWFPKQASAQAGRVDRLFDVLLIISVPVFVLVVTVVIYSVVHFRMRPGEELKDGPPVHGNTRLEIVWTTIPAVVLVALCGYGYAVLHKNEASAANELRVRVNGVQFAWNFGYPAAGGQKAVATNELYLPVGQAVKFDITSQDVIHSFFVPAWRLKSDAVPGLTTHYRVKPDRIGDFPVVCAELCGLGHATMRQVVHVVPRAEFDAWLAKQRAAGGAAASGGGAGSGAGASS